jgi:hypothetical protein
VLTIVIAMYFPELCACLLQAMESDMSDLVSRMASVGAKSEVVNGSLSEKRLKIDKLVRVRRLLHVSHTIKC